MAEIQVVVVYALPQQQYLLTVALPASSSVKDAIQHSTILEKCPEIDLKQNKVGIRGRLAKLGDTLQQGDRVEIYRPLLADPKEIRYRRVTRLDNRS